MTCCTSLNMSYSVLEVCERDYHSVLYSPSKQRVCYGENEKITSMMMLAEQSTNTPPLYQVFLWQCDNYREKRTGFLLYCSQDEGEAIDGFKTLNSTLSPLIYNGCVWLTPELLNEIIHPLPIPREKLINGVMYLMQKSQKFILTGAHCKGVCCKIVC